MENIAGGKQILNELTKQLHVMNFGQSQTVKECLQTGATVPVRSQNAVIYVAWRLKAFLSLGQEARFRHGRAPHVDVRRSHSYSLRIAMQIIRP